MSNPTPEQIEVLKLLQYSLPIFVVIMTVLGIVVLRYILTFTGNWLDKLSSRIEGIGTTIREVSKDEAQAIRDNTKELGTIFSSALNSLQQHLNQQDSQLVQIDKVVNGGDKKIMDILKQMDELSSEVHKISEKVTNVITKEEWERLQADLQALKGDLTIVVQYIQAQDKKE